MRTLSLSSICVLCVFAACSAPPAAETAAEAATVEPAPAPGVVVDTPAEAREMQEMQGAPKAAAPRPHTAARPSTASTKVEIPGNKQTAAAEPSAAPVAAGGASTTMPRTELYYWDSCMMVGLAVPPHCER